MRKSTKKALRKLLPFLNKSLQTYNIINVTSGKDLIKRGITSINNVKVNPLLFYKEIDSSNFRVTNNFKLLKKNYNKDKLNFLVTTIETINMRNEIMKEKFPKQFKKLIK